MFKKTLVLVAAVAAMAAVALGPGAALAGASEAHAKASATCPPGVTIPAYCTPSVIEIASINALVVKPSHSTRIVLACFGKTPCVGVLTITYHGVTIGRKRYNIAGESIGVVRVRLTKFGYKSLKAAGRLKVRVSAVDQDGPSDSDRITLYFIK